MRRDLALIGIAASLICCNVSVAAQPQAEKTETAIVQRLDAILQRLEAIEKRLARVEADTKLFTDWTVDDHGVVRPLSGNPVGFWGIDGPSTMQTRR